MDGLSNRSLKYWYCHISDRFFRRGELPVRNVVVRWSAPEDDEYDIASTDYASSKRNSYLIILNREKITTQSIKLSTLLHEMIHVATCHKSDSDDGHGIEFEKWRVKLGARGAFLKGALIKNVTLF
jgi:hypothetical protein